MDFGFVRAACAAPALKVADCRYNAERIAEAAARAAEKGAAIATFPELCVTGSTCGELFLQATLQRGARDALDFIAEKTAALDMLIVLGAPLAAEAALFNCAFFLYRGAILAAVPKTYIPNCGESYQKRYFASGAGIRGGTVRLSARFDAVPFGTDIFICDKNNAEFVVGAELSDDLSAPLPPSCRAALSGARIIVNLAASNEIAGRAEQRRLLVAAQSARTCAAYLYAGAASDESSQDLIFGAHHLIAEVGDLLGENKPFAGSELYADIDLERIALERRRTTSFADAAALEALAFRRVYFDGGANAFPYTDVRVLRPIPSHPFVPESKQERKKLCAAVLQMQTEALAKRLRHLGARSAVIGLSGGLDSTLAYLVTLNAFDLLQLDRKGIRAVTLPCFGTSDRTYRNACLLAEKTGSSFSEINIADSVRRHFQDIGHDADKHDTVYENAQARERTQVLMDIANQVGAPVIGTGDLSELALGWCTYNGDQMSMYGVNASVPKTLVRYIVAHCAEESADSELAAALRDILDTPISPELLPPENGEVLQKTEDIVGPYELLDFFLYYLLRFGFSPAKILFLADCSPLPYPHDEKLKWLHRFYQRFFSQQFKRSCMPDGVKVGAVGLSPRGDWRMPSDASGALWLAEIDTLR